MAHIERNHPVHTLLDLAAHGKNLNSNILDQMLIDVPAEHLPEGNSLNRFRSDILAHAKQLTDLYNSGAHGPAARQAAEAAAEIADRMNTEQRSLRTNTTTAQNREIEDIVARVFDN
ncbi:hypothetical protein H9633_12860 [Microbacterium sp. Re1]|uniref:Uncharacterized protein n=1 Tax=Microbacterium commune TaxID=2762219 RepID=A0ABR8W8W7_9MICO|nr:hypothetical protein [Microbacterium commune]MBD8013176.1 hypothetical protein [Microbacterium commune]